MAARRFLRARPFEYATFDEVSWVRPVASGGPTAWDHVVGSWIVAWSWLTFVLFASLVVTPSLELLLGGFGLAVVLGFLAMRSGTARAPRLARLTFGLHEIRLDHLHVGFTFDEQVVSRATGRTVWRARWEDVRGVTWQAESSTLVVSHSGQTTRLGPLRRWEGQRMAELARQRLARDPATSGDDVVANLAQLASLADRIRS